jgi:hypothetical protein
MNSNQLNTCKILKNEEILEGTNNYKTRAELLAPNKRTKDQNSKASSIQQKHPKLLTPNKKTQKTKFLAPNERTKQLGASTQSFHTPRKTTKVEF